MKSNFVKTTVIVLSAVLLALLVLLSVFSGVGRKEAALANEGTALAASADTVITTPFVTLEADGRQITVEDTAGKTVQQLLDQARIELKDEDMLVISPDQLLDGTLTIRLIRKCTVSVAFTSDDPAVESRCVIAMAEGTVADAVALAGIELKDDHIVNYELDKALEDGMEIQISLKEPEPEETEPAPTTPPSNPSPSTPKPTEPKPTEPKPTEPKPTEPKPTEPKPTEPKPTEPEPTEAERTIVSIEIYEDCDGSGHGVKVITYSDGTQEEVYF